MTETRILIVDDEPELRGMLRKYLTNEGLVVSDVATGVEALAYLDAAEADLVILDVGLPDIDGFEVLRRIRVTSDVPVIMLTARADEIDRVVGLSVGADDYVTKPFSPRELLARITAVLRRGRTTEGSDATILEFDGLRIDIGAREVRAGDETVVLSALEFNLLTALAENPNRVLSRQQLLDRVWGWDHYGVDRVVDVHVGNIRKAIGDDPSSPRFIATVRGAGYKFIGEPP
ncbi:MAG: response regulator transcription factor [Actinomycetia bacterium]|nr:response regulator transcription factor [Actinomycetes bacterium]